MFLARIRRYMQLAYLFHQCATGLLSRDGCIADCTVRHPGVERPFLVNDNVPYMHVLRAKLVIYKSFFNAMNYMEGDILVFYA